MNKLNRSGLRLQPCLTPFMHGKTEENLLFTTTLEVALAYIACRMLNNLELIPIEASFSQSNLWLMESNAFAKSTKHVNKDLFFFLYD